MPAPSSFGRIGPQFSCGRWGVRRDGALGPAVGSAVPITDVTSGFPACIHIYGTNWRGVYSRGREVLIWNGYDERARRYGPLRRGSRQAFGGRARSLRRLRACTSSRLAAERLPALRPGRSGSPVPPLPSVAGALVPRSSPAGGQLPLAPASSGDSAPDGKTLQAACERCDEEQKARDPHCCRVVPRQSVGKKRNRCRPGAERQGREQR